MEIKKMNVIMFKFPSSVRSKEHSILCGEVASLKTLNLASWVRTPAEESFASSHEVTALMRYPFKVLNFVLPEQQELNPIQS
jgi:hypothetical protein